MLFFSAQLDSIEIVHVQAVCGFRRCSLACFVALYLFGGVLYMRLIRKAKGLNQIPNYDFWRDFGALQAVSV